MCAVVRAPVGEDADVFVRGRREARVNLPDATASPYLQRGGSVFAEIKHIFESDANGRGLKRRRQRETPV